MMRGAYQTIDSNDNITKRRVKLPRKPATIDVLFRSGPSMSMFCTCQIDLSRHIVDLILKKKKTQEG